MPADLRPGVLVEARVRDHGQGAEGPGHHQGDAEVEGCQLDASPDRLAKVEHQGAHGHAHAHSHLLR